MCDHPLRESQWFPPTVTDPLALPRTVGVPGVSLAVGLAVLPLGGSQAAHPMDVWSPLGTASPVYTGLSLAGTCLKLKWSLGGCPWLPEARRSSWNVLDEEMKWDLIGCRGFSGGVLAPESGRPSSSASALPFLDPRSVSLSSPQSSFLETLSVSCSKAGGGGEATRAIKTKLRARGVHSSGTCWTATGRHPPDCAWTPHISR